MRLHLPGLLLIAAFAWALDGTAQKAPPKLEPVPEPPPPPPEVAADPDLQPQVTIIQRENETIEEYRVNGRLTMIKVTPRHGRPYFLVAEGVNGAFVRRDSLDSGMRVPLWLLYEF